MDHLRGPGHGRHVERGEHHRRRRRPRRGAGTFCFAVLSIMGYWIFRHFSIYHVLPASAIDLALVSVALAGGCIGFLGGTRRRRKSSWATPGRWPSAPGWPRCLLLNLDLLLLIIGGLFVMETVSVILQIISFRAFHRHIFRMAPIHHHSLSRLARDDGHRPLLDPGGLFCRVGPRTLYGDFSRWRSRHHLLRRGRLGCAGSGAVRHFGRAVGETGPRTSASDRAEPRAPPREVGSDDVDLQYQYSQPERHLSPRPRRVARRQGRTAPAPVRAHWHDRQAACTEDSAPASAATAFRTRRSLSPTSSCSASSAS